VRAVFDALDRDATTLLLEKVLQAWVLPNIGSLIDRTNQVPEPDFSELTPIVVECAQLGDDYAAHVLERGGQFLGMYAALAVQRVRKLEGAGVAPCEVAFTGSILRQIAPVREAMFAAIRHEIPGIRIRTEAVDSVQGALWRARQHGRSEQPANPS
jgi:N-acetylglucosamine kinase-like BadF-type ATPase